MPLSCNGETVLWRLWDLDFLGLEGVGDIPSWHPSWWRFVLVRQWCLQLLELVWLSGSVCISHSDWGVTSRRTFGCYQSLFFWCHYDGGIPFSGICHRGDDTLGLECLEFCFEFFSVCIGDGSWHFQTEWFGLFCNFNVKISPSIALKLVLRSTCKSSFGSLNV